MTKCRFDMYTTKIRDAQGGVRILFRGASLICCSIVSLAEHLACQPAVALDGLHCDPYFTLDRCVTDPERFRRKGPMWTNPIISITVFMILYGIGKAISKKTKGIIVEALFLSAVYIIGFLTGIFPESSLADTGIPAVMAAFGTMLLVTNLGTMIELRRFVREWRTVVICVAGLLVVGALFCTVGAALFNRYYALCALPPVAGGVVAASLVITAAEEAGMSDYGAFASLVCSLQTFVGVPVASFLLHKYCDKIFADQSYLQDPAKESGKSWPDLRVIKSLPSLFQDSSMMVARLLLITLLGSAISTATGGTLPAAVVVLVLGIVFTEIGFLERQTLSKAGYMNFLIMGLVMLLPHGFRSLTLASFGAMLPPILFFLVLGAAGLLAGGAVMGRILKVDWRLASAASLSAMFGYPLTEIVSRAVVASYGLPAEEEEKMLEAVMPQLVIAGFTTVTVASVALAGFIAPIIFG